MTSAYERHYQEMKRRLERCGRNTTDRLWTGMQQAAIAGAYRDRLPLPGVHLTPPEYFKEHLPRFEAEVQYYELRYEAERCRPEDADRTWAAFWLQEVSRMTQLIEAHPELYAYFRDRRTDRDSEYFGGDPALAEQNATLWASFLALARYEQDLERNLHLLFEYMNTPLPLPTCWIIDPNREAAVELSLLLQNDAYGQVIGTSASVAEWAGQPVDCLFIRITAWDDYLWWRSTSRRQGAGAVIFLSGRYEKCTQQLHEKIDFHLKPPYRASRVAAVLRRIGDPDFSRRSLDLFFLKAGYRFEPIYFSHLLYVRGYSGGTLDVRTSDWEYTVSGTLRSFERRLPIPWQRVNRSLLVNQYEPRPLEKPGRSFG